MDGWDSAPATSKKVFLNKVRTRWCSMKDRFNTDVCAEGQVCSGSAARTRTKYRYHRNLEFLRPVLATEPPGSAPCNLSLDRFFIGRPLTHLSHSTARKHLAGQPHRQLLTRKLVNQVFPSQVSATGYAGTKRQRQRALDRPVLPEFMHLSEAFHASLKSLSDRVESVFSLMERGFNQMKHRFNSVKQRLDRLEADLNRPAHPFFSKIEWGMVEHLRHEQQLSVLQACNTAYLQAIQQNRYVQQSTVSFPPVPPLTRFTTVPTSAAYHCTATSMQSLDSHHYSTTSLSAAGHLTSPPWQALLLSGAPPTRLLGELPL
ncbi:uncharacterized protein [Dendrobates tinctorius]|uniref:uncharacterized protein n=1 Tax=Dendrobates tinctorius TaxID=92724 RepID=UPI003CC9D758